MFVYACGWERSGTFILDIRLDMCQRKRIYKTNIETGAMEDVTTKMFEEDGFGSTRVPMEIDWPALLMSRLGVVDRPLL